jgi:iron complex outermembrane recepter protein
VHENSPRKSFVVSNKRSLLCASALILGVLPLSVNAQTVSTGGSGSDAETIIVTGQRQAYRADIPLKLTPQAIVVLDADTLSELGITAMSEALDLSAATARQNNFGGLWDSFAVRGFAGDENLPSSYLVNGFNAGRGFGGPRDVVGIERIEILKGPNAAIFGRGEPGGSVNIVTKRPKFEAAGVIGLTLGSFEKTRLDGDWTGPLTDTLAIRMTGYFQQAKSFRDTIETKRSAIMPSMLWQLSGATTLSYEGEFSRQEIPFDRGVVSLNNRLDIVPISRFLGEPDDGPLNADADGHQFQLQHDFNADWSVLLGVGYRETDLEGFSTEAELVGSRQRLFVDGQNLSRQRRFRDYEAQHSVYRGEISGRFEVGGLENKLLMGFDVDEFENSQLFLRYRPPSLAGNPTPAAGNIINITNPVYGQFPLPTVGPQTNRLDVQEARGVYFQNQIKVSENLQLRLGGRYDDLSSDSLNRATNTATSFKDTKFSPQFGFVYTASAAFTLYGAYGQGFRPNSGADFSGKAFAPEESESSEIGARVTLLDGKLEATLSAFFMTKANVITADPNNAGFSLAIGEAESRGLEADIIASLPGELDLRISYAAIAAQVSKDGLDPNFASVVRRGDRLINVPDQTLSIVVSKEFDLSGRELELGGGLLYVGDRLGETATTFELPGYTSLRLYATYELTDKLEIAATINNLADTTYYTNSFGRLWVAPGAPRNGSLSLRYRF